MADFRLGAPPMQACAQRVHRRYGRKAALTLSIYLISIPTMLIGCIPVYDGEGGRPGPGPGWGQGQAVRGWLVAGAVLPSCASPRTLANLLTWATCMQPKPPQPPTPPLWSMQAQTSASPPPSCW